MFNARGRRRRRRERRLNSTRQKQAESYVATSRGRPNRRVPLRIRTDSRYGRYVVPKVPSPNQMERTGWVLDSCAALVIKSANWRLSCTMSWEAALCNLTPPFQLSPPRILHFHPPRLTFTDSILRTHLQPFKQLLPRPWPTPSPCLCSTIHGRRELRDRHSPGPSP